MINYNRSAFGWKLIFRFHGSAIYRSVVPALFAVALFNVYKTYVAVTNEINEDGEREKDVIHPYAVGVLVTSSTFLIVFRLNQSYNRYWEACGNTHQFMSKWMDATTHTCVYHMQCDHYKGIRPPSFFDYPELNNLYMTRDRERMNFRSFHQGDANVGNSGHDSENGSRLRNRRHSHTQPQNSQSQTPDIPPAQRFGSGNVASSGENGVSRGGEYGRQTSLGSSLSGEQSRKKQRDEMKDEYIRRSSVKSINHLDNARYRRRQLRRETWQSNNRTGQSSVSSLYSIMSKSVGDTNKFNLERNNLYEESVFHEFGSEPIPLVGNPRLDGNWTNYYTKNPKQPLCTFMDPHRPDNIDPKGFASCQGDRTPPLFLQELAHLSSLLSAVALSTLRHDKEGCESPLAIYESGQPWPEVDPNKDELLKEKSFAIWLKTFFGVGLTAEERSKHNAAQPLPVIGGVSDAEIRFLQIARGPYAKTQLCFNWLSEFIIREHLAGSLGKVAPPIVSRIFQFLGDGMIYYNHARKIMFIPFPFGHAQLSIFFVYCMIFIIPLLMHEWTNDGLLGGCLTFFTVLCLAGINEVARDLENPFRNFPNELPLVNFQAQFNESLMTMYAGFHPDSFWDGDQVLRMARSSGRGGDRNKQDNSVIGLDTNTPSEGYINNITINVKPQKSGDIPPLDSVEGDSTEVAALKLQLEYQAKLIEELYAKVGDILGKDDTN